MRLLLLAFLFSCSLIASATAKPNVLATIVPVHSLVANVMGDVGEPTLLLKGAASPHSFALSPSGATALSAAKRVFWVGPEMETFLPHMLTNLAPGVPVAFLEQKDITPLSLREGGAWQAHDHHGDEHDDEVHEHHDDHEAHDDHDVHDDHDTALDAHLWLDPHVAMKMVAIIADELSAADPANRSTYMVNAAETTARLQQLDQELDATLAAVRNVPYVVFHDAYQYFEARYHLNAVGSITLNPEQAPGARRIYDIRERIAASGAVCIFSEPQFEPRLVATVVEGTDVKISVLDPVGAALTPGPDSYFSLMRQMAHALSDCLS